MENKSESKIKKLIPIEKQEFPKFIYTAMMMLIVVYVYSILRASKDSLVISHMGAELLSAIKLYGVLPSAVIFMLIYAKIVDMMSRIALFHVINWFFIGFFCIFALFLYPNYTSIHFDVSNLQKSLPFLKYFLTMIGGWSFSLFYILSELWGSIMLSLLFWQMANQITSLNEAKRFYPLFGFVAQAGLILAGQLGKFFSDANVASGSWDKTLNYITLSILFAGIGLSYCLWNLQRIVGADVINDTAKKDTGKKKIKMGFIESLKYIASSKSILLITLLLLCYGTSINLVEGIWKKSMNMQFPDGNSYGSYMGSVQIWTGIISAIAMLSGTYLLRVISWKYAALFTPIIIFVTGSVFFIFMIFQTQMTPFLSAMGFTALYIAVFSGGVQNVFSKGVKYAFFDPTKEMAYIPLDPDLKTKGKAAADVVGARLGKSSGAFIQQISLMLIVGSDLLSLTPGMFVIFLVIMVIWFFAVVALSKEFEYQNSKNNDNKEK
ncbi:Npt1/Npt2 family nucleotide transporter [Lyticum sinuosum]|uniref:ADP,ATP carrier protein n=1 Tax=Lyticum sinuosum TaxID=1332059 RepID=A0AAE4VK15_9RICK|nr:Npt1/Npt2 family nucleotide transporter [Lyticum sinuosum]MDZ5761202.1 Tlc1 type NTP/NDP exchange transporter [Lyticum sinuosum]